MSDDTPESSNVHVSEPSNTRDPDYWVSVQHGVPKISYTDDSDPAYKWFPVWAEEPAQDGAINQMCHRKTDDIVDRDGYVKTGYVLKKADADRPVCVVDGGAVSWFRQDEWNWLIHNRDHVEFSWPKPYRSKNNGSDGNPIVASINDCENLFWLAARDIIFFGTYDEKAKNRDDGWHPAINCNDTFYYASADATSFEPGEAAEIRDLVEKFGTPGAIAWASLARGEMPLGRLQTESFNTALAYLKKKRVPK